MDERRATSRHKGGECGFAALSPSPSPSSSSTTFFFSLTRCLHLRDRLVPKPKIHIRRIEHQDGLQRYVRDQHHVFMGRQREVKVRRARDFGLLFLAHGAVCTPNPVSSKVSTSRTARGGAGVKKKKKKTSPGIVVPDSQAWSPCSWALSATERCPSWADRVRHRQGRCDHRSTTGWWKI